MSVKEMYVKVVVGSTNPVKIEAVKTAFEMAWPEQVWDVTGVPAASGVSVQPMSNEECIEGWLFSLQKGREEGIICMAILVRRAYLYGISC
jgi:non-canonical (house-cleaning) NTP pyrophosphatase